LAEKFNVYFYVTMCEREMKKFF